MSNYWTLLAAVAPVFVMVLAGYGIRRAGWLTIEADVSLLRMVVNLLYPCLILQTILGNSAVADPKLVMLAPVVGFGAVVAGYAACYWSAPVFGIVEMRRRRAFAFTGGLFNYGYIAIPVVQQLFGEQTAGVVFLHNVGVEVALWTVGIMLLTGTSPREGWRRIFSAPVLAIFSALLLNSLGAGHWLPAFLLSAVKSLGATAVPIGLVLTGAAFADQLQVAGGQVGSGQVGLGACILRLGLLPCAMLALVYWVPLPLDLRRVVVVQAAMPSAVIPVILARHYGVDAPAALRVVLATSAVGLLTIPLWLKIGLHVLGQ